MSRRAFLGGLAATGVATSSGAIPWVGGTGATRASAAPLRRAAPRPNWSELGNAVRGPVLRPGERGYLSALRTYDPRRDDARPAAVVRVVRTADVVATLAFARRYGLGIRPRSGGHSYVGASTGNGVLVVDTRRLDGINLSASRSRVRVGAGVALGTLHDVLDAHDLTVPTGTCPTVGVSGLTLGGGLGAESRLYGLTLDAVTAIQVVTGAGRTVTASPSENADLFWALRGGGGGNFGVVTQFVLKTSAARSAEFFFLRWPASAAVDVVRGWQDRLQDMPRTSWDNVHLEAAGGTVVPRIVGLSWGGSAQAEVRFLSRSIGAAPVSVSYASRSHAGAVSLLAGSGAAVRRSWVAGSDVVEETLSGARARAIVAVVRRRGAAGLSGALILDPLDGAVHDGSTRTSSFPWRGASASLQWYVGLPNNPTASAIQSGRRFIARGHAAVGAASSGGYVNYLEPGRPLRAYYGGSWSALVKANQKYDPAHLFSSRFSLPD